MTGLKRAAEEFFGFKLEEAPNYWEAAVRGDRHVGEHDAQQDADSEDPNADAGGHDQGWSVHDRRPQYDGVSAAEVEEDYGEANGQ